MRRLRFIALLTLTLSGVSAAPALADAKTPRSDAAVAISVPAQDITLAERLTATLPGSAEAHAHDVTRSTARFVRQALAVRAAADKAARSRPGFAMYVPAYGRITASFGSSSGLWWNKHTGMDINARYGSPVRAVVVGKVIKVAYDRYYGRTIVMRGRGVDIWYAHLSAVGVKTGQHVRAGTIIGRVGCTGHCTGSHLHLEVRRHDLPTNPATYLWGTRVGKPGESPAWAQQRITRLSDL